MIFARSEKDVNEDEIIDKIRILKSEGFSNKEITKILTKLYIFNKNTVYKLCLENK